MITTRSRARNELRLDRDGCRTRGSLYYVDHAGINGHGTFIRRMQPSGTISIVAGSGTCSNGIDPIVNGLPAVQANLCRPYGLTIGPDETIYFGDADSPKIAQVKSDGIMSIVAGVANGSRADGVLARDAQLDMVDVKIGPDGALYLSTNNAFPSNAHIRKISASLPGFPSTAFVVASRDGREVYSFDAQGRHQNTRDGLTGAIIRTFGYDAAGRLSQLTEKTGGTDNITTIQHDGSGNPTKIIGPFGQETLLGVDANGFMAGITNPAGETIQLNSTAQGLLQKFTDPRGNFSQYVYDGVGLLTQATDAAGKVQTFVRTAFDGGYSVAKTTSLGRTTTYAVEVLPNGDHRLTTTLPGGESTQWVRSDDGTRDVTFGWHGQHCRARTGSALRHASAVRHVGDGRDAGRNHRSADRHPDRGALRSERPVQPGEPGATSVIRRRRRVSIRLPRARAWSRRRRAERSIRHVGPLRPDISRQVAGFNAPTRL